jgi:hypothetical protein
MEHNELKNLIGCSRVLGIPAAYLKATAKRGDIPCLQVGRKLYFNTEAVRAKLSVLAAQGASDER